MALTIKDGAGSTTSLKTTLTGSDHMPHHIVQAVSGTVTVTSSVANPVYVTGNISVNQPINVDVDISDKLTVVISSSANNNAVWVTSSATYPVFTQLSNITTTGIPGGGTALVVSLSGSTGSFNQVQLFDSYVTIANTGINQLIGYLTAATDLGNSDYRLKVITTGSSAVTINNSAADAAFSALSYSFADNSLKVKLTGSNTVKEGSYDILLVRGTGSQTEITNNGFNQLINYLTASTDLSDNDYRLKVKITGSSGVLITNTTGSPGNIRLSDIAYQNTTAGNALLVKVTASNQDVYSTQLSNVSTAAFSGGAALVVRITSSNEINPVYITGNVDLGVAKYGFSGGAALVTKITASATQDNPFWVTGTVSTIGGGGSVSDGLKVELSGSNVKTISGSLTNTYLQTSIAPVATGSALKTFAPPNWGGPVPSGDPNVIIFDWSAASGTVNAASSSINRKSLTFFNDSPHNVYIMMGEPIGGYGQTNGFSIYQVSSKPNFYSFVLYPSGTYFAEPHNVGMKHGMFLVSSSVSSETRVFITETY